MLENPKTWKCCGQLWLPPWIFFAFRYRSILGFDLQAFFARPWLWWLLKSSWQKCPHVHTTNPRQIGNKAYFAASLQFGSMLFSPPQFHHCLTSISDYVSFSSMFNDQGTLEKIQITGDIENQIRAKVCRPTSLTLLATGVARLIERWTFFSRTLSEHSQSWSSLKDLGN